MWPSDRLQRLLSIEHPVIQAPMAGASTVAMAVAVANAGGLGSLACAMLSAEQMRAAAAELGAATPHAINFNFFVHAEPDLAAYDPAPMQAALAPYYAEAGLEAPPEPRLGAPAFNDAMLETLLDLSPKIVSFHFGLPSLHAVEALNRAGAVLIGNATCVAEARALEAAGMDAIIAQGLEAGGHRGAFIGAPHENDMGLFALVPMIADAVRVPVIAAGGIYDGRGVAAAFALGACGVQLGTAFLRAPECSVSMAQKNALADTPDNRTRLTRLFSGRPARALRNRFTDELTVHESETAPFPTQRALAAPLVKASLAAGKPDFAQMWSGQAGPKTREKPSAEIFGDVVESALALMS